MESKWRQNPAKIGLASGMTHLAAQFLPNPIYYLIYSPVLQQYGFWAPSLLDPDRGWIEVFDGGPAPTGGFPWWFQVEPDHPPP